MTEKRFRMEFVDSHIYHIVDYDGRHIGEFELLDLLNQLHEENMMLKGEVAHYKLILMSLKEGAKRITEKWKCRD